MHNQSLVTDYITRARHRLASLEVLHRLGDYADVVRGSQEAVELALKALLRHAGVEVPRVHDVSSVLEDNVLLLPAGVHPHVPRLATVSRQLRRDRELAFYGSEDLTPLEFYKKADADEALAQAGWVVDRVQEALPPREPKQ